VGDNNSALLVHGPEIVGVNANLKTVQVGDVTGRYYEGVRLGSGKWEPDSKIKHLRWQVNGRAFELISVGTGLQLKDLIAIAESYPGSLGIRGFLGVKCAASGAVGWISAGLAYKVASVPLTFGSPL
jgi:hypothetical protein